jgi:uncharacterized membrane protein
MEIDVSIQVDQDQHEQISDAVQKNVEKVQHFERKQGEKRSGAQKTIERVSLFFGSTGFFLTFIASSAIWIVVDTAWHYLGHSYFDAPPFPVLQGCVAYVGVLITIAVLIRQNRLARVEESRAHLELQVNLLAEQKTTKIIMLLEELRRDMPNVRDRQDDHAAALQASTDSDTILDEFEKRK